MEPLHTPDWKTQITNFIYFLCRSIPCDSTALIFMRNSTLSSILFLINKCEKLTLRIDDATFPVFTLVLIAKWEKCCQCTLMTVFFLLAPPFFLREVGGAERGRENLKLVPHAVWRLTWGSNS